MNLDYCLNEIDFLTGYSIHILADIYYGSTIWTPLRFGSNNQYIQLGYMHVSFGYRNKGIGKKLFKLCISKTKEIGVEKIYISANTSEETQKFYLSIGCIDAEEINKELAENEPYDRQMEYKILKQA